ncbi:unnamed protein product [Cochlearia groenlandica]
MEYEGSSHVPLNVGKRCEIKDNKVHGWISTKSHVCFWLISPSGEYRSGGLIKQELTSHVGPTAISVNEVAPVAPVVTVSPVITVAPVTPTASD